MTPQEREELAQALYEAYISWHSQGTNLNFTPWEKIQERTQEMYRSQADAAYAKWRQWAEKSVEDLSLLTGFTLPDEEPLD